MKRLAPLLTWTAFVLAVFVGLGAASLFLLERTGYLARFLREQIARELGAAGEGLTIGDATLSWFNPGLHVTDVRLAAKDGSIHIERLDVLLRGALDPRDVVQSVQIAGGQVLYSAGLGARIDAILQDTDSGSGERGPSRLPRLRIRDLRLALPTPGAGELPVGSLDMVVEPSGDQLLRASGHLRPAGADAVLHVSAQEEAPGEFLLRAGSRGLPLSSLALGSELAAFEPAGQLRIDATARLHLDGNSEDEATARVSLRDGRVRPAPGQDGIAAGVGAIEALEADLTLTYAGQRGVPFWHVPAWDLRALLRGEWNESQLTANLLAGQRAGGGVSTSVQIANLPLEAEQTLELIQAIGIEEDIAALDPRGRIDVSAGARFAWTGATLDLAPELVAHAQLLGDTSLAYYGWPSAWDGEIEGVPLPAEGLRGFALLAGRGAPFDWSVGLLGQGAIGQGSVDVLGTLSPPPADGQPVDLDMEIVVRDVAIDEALREALNGMEATRPIWDEYGPRAGTVASAWRLRRTANTLGLFAEGRVDVSGGAAAWGELPVPVEDVSGSLRFHWTERGTPIVTPLGEPSDTRASGVSFDFSGRSATIGRVHLGGHTRDERNPPPDQPRDSDEGRVNHVRLDIEALPLRGSDWEIIAAGLPEIADEVRQLQPSGKVDVIYQNQSVRNDDLLELAVEVEPRELILQPVEFPMRTEQVRGRVCVRADELPDGTPLPAQVNATVTGRWAGGAAVAASGGPSGVRSARGDQLRVFAAGVDPANPAVRGSLSEALGKASGERVDLSAMAVNGHLDVFADLSLDSETERPNGDAEGLPGTLRLTLRNNSLSLEDISLDQLQGVLTLEGGVLRGERILARLGTTPVELHNAAFLSSDFVHRLAGADPVLSEPGMLPPEPVSVLQADLHAKDLPLDRTHLQGFLDRDSLRALLDDADLVGLVDLQGTRLLVTGDGGGGARVVVHGDLLPHGLSLDPGLPARVSSARVHVHRMLYEAGRLRAWADLSDVYARIADRELSAAQCVVGYADGRLTLQGLDGVFEGGRVRSLGDDRAGAAMHADLAEPFRFDLALEFEGVDVDGVMEGLFPSYVSDTGHLNAQLRLAGSLADPLRLVGDGSGWIGEARLWSIPVVRGLFSRLGFDGTAVFDRMTFRVRLRDGVVSFPEIAARSPLLQLVGRDGAVDLDGRLSFDLEVRYSLIDNLGPINRLVYWVQNNLLRVSVRGNMARPQILLRNSLGELLGGPDLRRQDLPLPELSPLPARF